MLCKVFTKIIMKRLTSHKPHEQDGFRKHLSSLDHPGDNNFNREVKWINHTLDNVCGLWKGIRLYRNRCIICIKHLQKCFVPILLENTNKMKIKRDIRQRHTISPKLFALALEDVLKKLHYKCIINVIDVELLNHMRFADDIVFITSNKEELQEMVN